MPDIDSLDFLAYPLLNNAVQHWLFALTVSVLVFLLIRIVIRLGVSRLARLAKETTTIWDDAVTDALSRTHGLFVFIIALFLGSLFLELPGRVQEVIVSVTSIALFIQGGLWLNSIGQFWIKEESQRRRKIDPATVTTVSAMGFVGRLVLWVLNLSVERL